MSGSDRSRLFLGALVTLLILACQLSPKPAQRTPTSLPTRSRLQFLSPTSTFAPTLVPAPSFTPSPTPIPLTPSPTPSPTPPLPDAGPLPAYWTDLNLSLSDPVSGHAGGIYGVYDLVMDPPSALLYALGGCTSSSAPSAGLCVSVYDPAVDRVLASGTVVSPSSSSGGEEGHLLLAGETLYVHQPWAGLLYALEPETLHQTAVLSDVYGLAYDSTNKATYVVSAEGLTIFGEGLAPAPLDRAYDTSPVELAAGEGQIYVLGDGVLLVYDDRLRRIAQVELPEGFLAGLVLDVARERLYIGGWAGLYVLDTQTLRVSDPLRGAARATVPNVMAMALDQRGERLFVLVRRQSDWYGGYTAVVVDTETWNADELYLTLSGELRDLAVDEDKSRLLLASATDHSLLPLSYETLQVAPRLPLGIEVDEVIVDPPGERLYVSDSAGWVHLFDRRTYDRLDRVYGGRHISLDADRGILYAGDPRVPVVTLHDAQTGQAISTIEQAGSPRANPAAGQVVILNRRFYVYDADSGQPVGVLLPGVGQPAAACPECYYTVGVEAVIDARRGYTATLTYTPWPGKPGPSESIDYDLASGRTYYSLRTGGYVHVSSIAVYADLAQLESREPALRALEGFSGDLKLDAAARQLYVARGDLLFVLDSETLNRLGRVYTENWTPTVAAVDGELGRLYLPHGPNLEIWTRTGGAPAALLPPEPLVLTNTVASILPSPNYAQDNTLLATIDGWPARSTDGGETWQRLRGGLPEFSDYRPAVELAFSPAFAEDTRIFAGVALGETHGEGVYCSIDGGDTWHACSDGLYDLRVYRVQPSPSFAQDRTLLAYARAQPGDVLYRSTDAGKSWRLELRQVEPGRPRLPSLGELVYLSEYEPEIECDFWGACRRSEDGGQQWSAFDTAEAPLENLVGARFSPQYNVDGTIYFLTQSDLVRYQEQGRVWSRCQASSGGQAIFGKRTYERVLSSLAVAASTEDTHDLLVGSVAGEFYRIAATDLKCTALAARPRPSTPQPTPPACAGQADARMLDLLLADKSGPQILERLGCAVTPAQTTGAAMQPFEHGTMLWREDVRQIYVLPDVAQWTQHEDAWAEGQPEPSVKAPQGLYAPVRGFGKLWREQLGSSESALGWATAPERGMTCLMQVFADGLLLQEIGGPLWILYQDGTWASVGMP